mgnify:CR=1 FL=1
MDNQILSADRLIGREKDIGAICRAAGKGINLLIYGDSGVGLTSVAKAAYERMANGRHPGRKLVYFDAYGTKRDIDETLFAASFRHKDVVMPELPEQSFEKHKVGNSADLERRVLAGVHASAEPYLFFLNFAGDLEKGTSHFFQNILRTGKVSIIAAAPKKSLSNAKLDNFFKAFDRYELKGLSDSKIAELFEHLVEKYGIEISDEDKAEIKRKLPRIAYGKPAAVLQKLSRALKEKKLNTTALLKDYPTTTTNDVYIARASLILLVVVLAYRYFLRMTGDPADMIIGGMLLALAIGVYRTLGMFS